MRPFENSVSTHQRFKRSFYVLDCEEVFIKRFLLFLSPKPLKMNSVRIQEGNKSGPRQLPKTTYIYRKISARGS